jgi:hypothetical protein
MSATQRAKSEIPEDVRRNVHRMRMASEITKEIASLSWGKDMTPAGRAAIGHWCANNFIDAETEIDVLGGRLYLNARYYLNRMQPLMRAGIVAYFYADNISPDPRLAAMAAWNPAEESDDVVRARMAEFRQRAAVEDMRREWERIEHKVPEAAEVAYVGRLRFTDMARELTGCKWWVPNATMRIQGRNGAFDKQKDPISDSGFGVETVETRALRRVARLAAGQLPSTHPARMEMEGAERGLRALTDGPLAEARNRAAMEAAEEARRRMTPLVAPPDPYALDNAPAMRALGPAPAVEIPRHGQHDAPVRVVTETDRTRPSPELVRRTLEAPDPMHLPPDPHAPTSAGPPTVPANTEAQSPLFDDDDPFGR